MFLSSNNPSQAAPHAPMAFVRNSLGGKQTSSASHCLLFLLTAHHPDFASAQRDNELIPASHPPTSPPNTTFPFNAPTTSPPSMSLDSTEPRKRGRPKGDGKVPKPVVYGPRPRLGRPPGTGYKQKQRVLVEEGDTLAAKRPRGRPRKQVTPAVSVEFGRMVCIFFPLF
jgi:hypothetical protein